MADFSTTDVAAHVAVPQNQFNPIQTLEGLANMQNAFNQNKMFQAKARAAQYYQQAWDPTTNSVDQNKFMSLIGPDQQAQMAAPDLMQAGSNLKQSAIANTQAQFNLNQGQMNALLGAAGAHAGQSADSVRQAVKTTAGVLGIDPSSILDSPMFATDDAVKDTVAAASIMPGIGTQGQQNATFGTPWQQNVGDKVVTGVTKLNPNGPATTQLATGPGSSLPVGAGPSIMSETMNAQSSSGAQLSFPKSLVMNPDMTMKPNVKAADGTQLTDAHGVLQTTLDANTVAQLAATAKNTQDQSAALQQFYNSSPQRMAIIKDMMGFNGDFKSGPGAAKWSGIVTEANRVLGTNFANDQASAQQVFGKLAEWLAAGQAPALGVPATNAGQEAAHLASANSNYSTDANHQVLAQFAGNELYGQAKHDAWDWAQKQHEKPTYDAFVSQFNPRYDVRSFWSKYQNDGENQNMMRGMQRMPGQADIYSKKDTNAEKLIKSLELNP